MEESKYTDLVIRDPYTSFERDGQKQFEGFFCTPQQLNANCQYLYSIVVREHVNEEIPHVHQFPVIMNFFGGDSSNIRDFDAEIWFYLGGERQVITGPATITIPPGLPHCPLIFTRVDKPVAWVEIMLTDGYERVELPDLPLNPDPGPLTRSYGH